MKKNDDYWVRELHTKHGALRKQLEIPKGKKIPITLLSKIKQTELREVIKNPTKIGKQKIKVTPLLKKRAVLAWNYKHMK